MPVLRIFLLLAMFALAGCGSKDPERGPAREVTVNPEAPPGALWSDPATWNGNPPDKNSAVLIPSGASIVLDQPACVRNLTLEGRLTFAPKDLTFCAEWIMAHHSGHLEVGTEEAPFQHTAVITLIDGDRNENVMEMGTKFLGAMAGGRIDLHGEQGFASWTQLTGPHPAGTTSLQVLDASGWKPGDEIVVATGSPEPDEAEVRRVTAVEGTTVTVDAPLEFARPGDLSEIEGRSIDRRAAVARLTRNIRIEGDERSQDGFGGHVMVMEGGSAYVDSVEFQRMGQFDQLGKYPFHWHIVGDGTGQYIKNSVVNRSLQRGIVVHSTQNVIVQSNVVFDSHGHNFLIETPTTTDNQIIGNLAVKNRIAQLTEPTLATQNDKQAANFWIRSARNTFRGNVAAGSASMGFWYDMTTDGPTDFKENVAYASASRGLADFVRDSGLVVQHTATEPLEFEDLLFYNNQVGMWPGEHGVQVYRNVSMVGNVAHAIRSETTGGGILYMEDPLFVRVETGTAIALQYGGTADIKRPVFVDYQGHQLFSTHDIEYPWMGDLRISEAQVRGAGAGFKPMLPDVSLVELAEDTILPRGFYLSYEFPQLATPDMEVVYLGSESENIMYFGPQRHLYGELQIWLGEAEGYFGSEDDARAEVFKPTEETIRRSDGLEYTSAIESYAAGTNGWAVITNSDLHYELTFTPSENVFAIGLDLHGGVWQTAEPQEVVVGIPLPNPPTRLIRGAKPGLPDSRENPHVELQQADSWSAFLADAPNKYFLGEGGMLYVLAREAFVAVAY
jgi:predicted small lipoprotein YifL